MIIGDERETIIYEPEPATAPAPALPEPEKVPA